MNRGGGHAGVVRDGEEAAAWMLEDRVDVSTQPRNDPPLMAEECAQQLGHLIGVR